MIDNKSIYEQFQSDVVATWDYAKESMTLTPEQSKKIREGLDKFFSKTGTYVGMSKDKAESKLKSFFGAAVDLVKKLWAKIVEIWNWIVNKVKSVFSKKESKVASEFVKAGQDYIEKVVSMVPKESVA